MTMKQRGATLWGLVIVMATGLTGCLSPIAMHRAVLEYDRTVSYVEADLLLLNIARARYHRPVHFTTVSSVAATFDFRTSAGIRGGLGPATDSRERPINLECSASIAENPTITIVRSPGRNLQSVSCVPWTKISSSSWCGRDMTSTWCCA